MTVPNLIKALAHENRSGLFCCFRTLPKIAGLGHRMRFSTWRNIVTDYRLHGSFDMLHWTCFGQFWLNLLHKFLRFSGAVKDRVVQRKMR